MGHPVLLSRSISLFPPFDPRFEYRFWMSDTNLVAFRGRHVRIPGFRRRDRSFHVIEALRLYLERHCGACLP